MPLAALTALQGLEEHGRVQPGQKVLIIGASRGVGTSAVQIAQNLPPARGAAALRYLAQGHARGKVVVTA